MAENIQLNKNVFSKRQYQKTIDTSFSQLGVKTVQEQIDEQPTVQEFFNLYNELFYEIPEEGETNSHEYLVKESGEYIDFNQINEDIQILLDEITKLREESLKKDTTILDLEQEIAQLQIEQTTQPNSANKLKANLLKTIQVKK